MIFSLLLVFILTNVSAENVFREAQKEGKQRRKELQTLLDDSINSFKENQLAYQKRCENLFPEEEKDKIFSDSKIELKKVLETQIKNLKDSNGGHYKKIHVNDLAELVDELNKFINDKSFKINQCEVLKDALTNDHESIMKAKKTIVDGANKNPTEEVANEVKAILEKSEFSGIAAQINGADSRI